MRRRIYVASSWRNAAQQGVVERLRAEGHDVYDFKNPEPGNAGFHWSEIDPAWKDWSPAAFREGLEHPVADRGFAFDMVALDECDACVLVLPCGRSAHLELGYAAGRGKPTFVLLAEGAEPELMYKMCDRLAATLEELVDQLASTVIPGPGHWLGCCLNHWHSGECEIPKNASSRPAGKGGSR